MVTMDEIDETIPGTDSAPILPATREYHSFKKRTPTSATETHGGYTFSREMEGLKGTACRNFDDSRGRLVELH